MQGLSEKHAFARLRQAAWDHPLYQRQDLATIGEQHSWMRQDGVAFALSLNR